MKEAYIGGGEQTHEAGFSFLCRFPARISKKFDIGPFFLYPLEKMA